MHPATQDIKKKYFILALCLLCTAYFIFEGFYIHYAAMGVDDFWFAHWTYRYRNELPYKDFLPYKTILGYYYLLIPMLSSKALFTPLINTKHWMAFTNAILFYIGALWLRSFFSSKAILFTVLLLISSEYVLTYSIDIRVDLLAYWFCFFSALFLLEERYFWAGVLMGLGLLTSQKAIWYLEAGNIALGLTWLFLKRDKKTFSGIIYYNAVTFFIIAVYIVFWANISSLKTVLNNMFYEAFIIYKADWYDEARKLFWTITISRNPLPFLLLPFSWCSLIVKPMSDENFRFRFFSVIYATVLMACLIPYKQVFPYYMIATLPAFLLAYSATFSWLFALFQEARMPYLSLTKKTILTLFLICYTSSLLFVCYFFPLPFCYYVICYFYHVSPCYYFVAAIPLLFGIYVIPSRNAYLKTLMPTLIKLTFIFSGFIYPFLLMNVCIFPERNGAYQKSTLTLANSLLADGSDYLAGIEFFYNKNQPIPGMRQLDGPSINYLYDPLPGLLPMLSLSSLYHTPVSADQAIQSIEKSKVKFYVNNYRMHELPPKIQHYLASEFEHFWASVYLYAPQIAAGKQNKLIKFNGNYLIESTKSIMVDNKKIQPNTLLYLKNKKYLFNAQTPFRIRLIPDNTSHLLQSDFKEDRWQKMFA